MKKLLLLATTALLAISAQATPITGEIHLSGLGGITLLNNFGPAGVATLANADALVFPAGNNSIVTAASYDFSTAFGSFAHQNNFAFNPTLSPSPVAPLWTLTTGPLAGWTFSLDSISLVDQSVSGFLNLAGSGRFNGGTYDETVGAWSLTVTTTGSLFTWTSSNSSVPDGGMTVMLLGAGLSCVGLIRRKINA